MRLLLDTHIFLWACEAPAKLTASAREALASAENDIAVSSVVAWEIAIKCAIGRLRFPLEFWNERIAELGVDTLPITAVHGIEAGLLPRHHGDPFDRMLVAQARIERLTIVTLDPLMKRYDVPIFAEIN